MSGKSAPLPEGARPDRPVKTDSGRARGALAALLRNELLHDCLSILLLSAGLSAALVETTALEGSLWSALAFSLPSLAIVAAASQRWWIAPAALAGSASALLIWQSVTETRWITRQMLEDLFRWIRTGLPYDPLFTDHGAPELLQGLLVLAVTAFAYALVRGRFSFPVLCLAVLGVFPAVYLIARPDDLTPPLSLAAGGLIIQMPRLYAAYVERSSPGGGVRRGALQLMAVPVALAAIACSLFIVPQDTSGWRSRGLNNLYQDVTKLVRGPFAARPSHASNFSLAGLGFQPEQDRLGGPASLTDDVLLTVKSPRPVLLRGAVRDSYDGQSWSVGGLDGDLRLGGLFWRGYQREAFGFHQPSGGREARRLYGALTENLDLQVTYNDSRYATLFAPGGVRSMRLDRSQLQEQPHFNMRGETYLHQRIPRRTTLDLSVRVWRPRDEEFHRLFLELETAALAADDAGYGDIAARCLSLPEDLPQPVFDCADAIAGGIASPYEKALAIQDWLREHCAYTLEPEVPPDEDFVAHFLETREGYCTYYASAMAVLARCAGLPSRYVTGFALEEAPRDGEYRATGKTAHAWAEIYFHGIGWLEFDPLSWDAGQPLNEEAPDWLFDPEDAAEEAPAAAEQNSHRESAGPATETEHPPVPVSRLLIRGACLLALFLALRAGLRLVMNSKIRAYRRDRIRRKAGSPSHCLDCYYSDILRQLSLLELSADPGETLLRFPGRVDRRVRFEGVTLQAIAHARMKQYFAGSTPEEADLEAAHVYHEKLERLLMERMGKPSYFFRRAIRRSG